MVANMLRMAVLVLLCHFSLQTAAQKPLTLKQLNKRLDASQNNFTKMLGKYPIDNSGKVILNRFITTETDSLQMIIKNDKGLPLSQKLLALDCQCNLLDTLLSEVANKTLDANNIRESRDNFIPLWQTILTQKSCDDVMRPFGPRTAGLMAAVFKDYPQASRLKDIATLKSIENKPENILQFLGKNIDFSLRDSLIFIIGNTQPERLISYLSTSKDDTLLKLIRQHPAPLIQTLLSIANDRNMTYYLPFVLELSEKKVTLAEIDKARTEPSQFFRILVDAEINNQARAEAGEAPLYVLPTRQYLKKYAIKFYTDVINSLHEQPKESDRYFVLDGLRPQDLYFIITSGETELYTSSYLYTYKKLMSSFDKNNSDSLFRLVKYDQYRKFLLMAGRYNMLSAFMQQMPVDKSISIIKKLMLGLEEHDNTGTEETINVAETFPGIVKDDNLFTLTYQEIKNNYARCQSIPNPYGMKVYTILTEIFNAVKSDEWNSKKDLPPALAVYFKIPHSALVEKNGKITQLVLFYGDEDGKSSFSSFLSNFSDASLWSIEKNQSWVTIKSKKLFPVEVYANLPLNNDEDLDTKAQKSLIAFLKKEQIEPHILIHRGHSYHLGSSINYVTPATRLAVLGSCGGYREIFDLLAKSSKAQVISTKQIGSMQVNEPVLKLINEKLLNGKDLDWAELWVQLDKQFKSNKQVYDYFQEYVPPYKNIALLVATLFDQSGIQ